MNASKKLSEDFSLELSRVVNSSSKLIYSNSKNLLTYPLAMNVKSKNSSATIDVGTW
jgi:hypothetical protein